MKQTAEKQKRGRASKKGGVCEYEIFMSSFLPANMSSNQKMIASKMLYICSRLNIKTKDKESDPQRHRKTKKTFLPDKATTYRKKKTYPL